MDYNKEYEEGLKFAKAANGMLINKKVDNETLYHIISLSIEKFASSLAYKMNYMPEHSGLGFLFRGLKGKMEIPESFINEVRFLNGFMTYCSLEFMEPKPINQTDVTRMITFMNDLKSFAKTELQ